jgi:hypothetical protein
MRTTTVYESVAEHAPVVTVLPNGEREWRGTSHLYVYTEFVPETRLDDRMLRLLHTRRRRWMRLRRRWLA